MTELDILMLQAQNNQGTGMYSVAMAFSIWVAFRVSGITRDKYSDNLIVKIAATGFGLTTLFFFNMTYAFWSWNMAATAHRLAELQVSGTEISAVAQGFVENMGATATVPSFSIITSDPIAVILQVSILVLIMLPIWTPKK
jgi:hypothetical protein